MRTLIHTSKWRLVIALVLLSGSGFFMTDVFARSRSGKLSPLRQEVTESPMAPDATPASGTLTPTNQTVTYTDGPLVVNPTHLVNGQPICTAPNSCSDFTLTVSASTMAASHNMVWTMQWPLVNVDCDMFILKDGNLIAANIGYADPSALALPIPADGTIYHLVTSCTTGTAPLTGTAKLEAKYPTSGQGAGVPPRFINYPSGSGQANSAGEPSIGVDWNPNVGFLKHEKVNTGGVAIFTAVNDEWRVNFDDCSSPAVNVWEDTNSPIVTGLDPIGFVDHFSTAQLGISYPPTTTPGRIFHLQLLTAAGSHGAVSDNDGGSWISHVAGGPVSGIDHETLGGGPFHAPLITPPPPAYPNATYYCSQYGVENADCSRSDDGGLTFGPSVPIFPPQLCAGGLHGHIKVSPQGTAYVPNSACAEGTGPNLGVVGVALSKDNGITWNHQSVPGSSGSSDPAIGIGQNNMGKPLGQVANTIYLGWVSADGHAHAAHSPDEGETWEDDIDVSSIFGIEQAVFPAMVAGDDNRASFAFLGTHPAFYPTTKVWHLYIATTYDGGNSWILVDATPIDPVQIGNICLLGTGCNGARNLLDFNGIDVDAEGRVLVAYADGCVNCSNNQTTQSAAAKGTITRQSGGRRLFSAFDPNPAEPALPAAPRVLSAIRKTVPAPGVEVGWLEPDNGGSPITGYKIYRSQTSGTETFLASVSGANTLKYFDTAAPDTSNWYYRVTAVNAIGEGDFCREVNVNGVQPAQNVCTYPYLTLTTDPTGDQTGGPNANTQEDIQRIAVGEPFISCTDKSLTFVMKLANLSPTPPPGAGWTISFNAPGTTLVLFVRMDTQTNATPDFNYGYYQVSPASAQVVQCGRPTVPTCPVTGSYLPDGTIVMTLDTTAPLKFFQPQNTGPTPSFTVNLAPGAVLTNITGTTQLGALQAVDTTTGGTNSYTVAGNLACNGIVPEAVLSANPLMGAPPLNVNFDASASRIPSGGCGTIASYTLDFGDGSSPVTQATPLFTHSYTSAGTYQASLTVTDSNGQVSDNPAQVVITVQTSQIQLNSVVSRKVHGAAGTFDLSLPLAGVQPIECRSGGASNAYTIIFRFPDALANVAGASVTGGTGSVSSSNIGTDPHEYIVNLTGVTNAQTITVTLTNAQDVAGHAGNVSKEMRVLVGDTTADGAVNSADIAQTKSQSGQAVTSSNYRQDVTVDGNINSADIALVKSKSGTALP